MVVALRGKPVIATALPVAASAGVAARNATGGES
jgi:hypothetical protein